MEPLTHSGGNPELAFQAGALLTYAQTPANVIEASHPFIIQVSFRIVGTKERFAGGCFRVEVSLEHCGTGRDVDLPVQRCHADAFHGQGADPLTLEYRVTVPAPGIPVGVYKVSTLITAEDSNGNPGVGVCFSDESTITIVSGESEADPARADLDRYHLLVDAKAAGRISREESEELKALDRKLIEAAQLEADELERSYPDTRAGRLEEGLKKVDELLAELRKSSQAG